MKRGRKENGVLKKLSLNICLFQILKEKGKCLSPHWGKEHNIQERGGYDYEPRLSMSRKLLNNINFLKSTVFSSLISNTT